MKLYVIFTVESDETGMTTIKWRKHLHLIRSHAFEEAKKIGPTSCVIELVQTQSWNLEQMEDEEF